MTLIFSCAIAGRAANTRKASASSQKQDRPAEVPVGRSICRCTRLVKNWALERELQPKLHNARVVHCRIHNSKARCVDVADWRAELRVVEWVEELRSEVQTHIFPGQRELFDHGKIRVHKTGPVNGQWRRVSKRAWRRGSERARVERRPGVAQMVRSQATLRYRQLAEGIGR